MGRVKPWKRVGLSSGDYTTNILLVCNSWLCTGNYFYQAATFGMSVCILSVAVQAVHGQRCYTYLSHTMYLRTKMCLWQKLLDLAKNLGIHSPAPPRRGGVKNFIIFSFQDISSEGFLNPIKHGVRQVAISWGGVQSARSLIGLSRDLIRPFLGHHTPLYTVGVYYGASRKKIFEKS